MKTLTTLNTRIFSSFIISVMMSFNISAQQAEAKAGGMDAPVTPAVTAERLSDEIARMTERATKLRARSRLAEGETKDVMLREAATLERECLARQIEYHQVNYSSQLQKIKSNRSAISDLQRSNPRNENQMHTKFLIDESEKNIRLAAQLYEEGSFQANPSNRIGSLDNSADKIQLAVNQQEEAIALLKVKSKKAKSKC